MILLKSLKLHNFFSHEDTTLALEENGKILVDGVSGSGKSSIVEAIVWCLYGKARTDNRSLVRRGSDKGFVKLELIREAQGETPAQAIVITRSITTAGKHALGVEVDGVAHELYNIRDLQAWIEKDLIGASYLLFVNSVAYLQNSGDLFILQNASKRKELLLEIVNAGNFDELAEKARKVASDLETRITIIDADIQRNVEWRGQAAVRISNKAVDESLLKSTRADIERIEKEKNDVTSEIAVLRSGESGVSALTSAVRMHKSSRDQAKDDLDTYIKAKETLESMPEPAISPETLENTIKEVDKELTVLQEEEDKRLAHMDKKPAKTVEQTTITYLQSKLKENESLNDCPSGDACPHQKGSHKFREDTKAEIDRLTKTLLEETLAFDAWNKELGSFKDNRSRIQALRTSIKELRDQHAAISYGESLRATLKKEADKIPAAKELLIKCEKQLKEAETALKDAQDRVDLSKLKEKQDRLGYLEGDLRLQRNKESELSAELKIIAELEKAVPEYESAYSKLSDQKGVIVSDAEKVKKLQQALGSKGLKTVVVDYLLPRLEEKINDVLAQMSDFRIHLDTQKPTVDGESMTEGLFITIINDLGEEMAWENYSGGERLKITVAISEALASLQKVGYRIFDETFVGLDDNSTEDFAGVVGRLQKRFRQVLMISHLTAVKGMFDNVITINKTQGISHVNRSAAGGEYT